MTARTFRKKPVLIAAMHWDGTESAATPIVDWVFDRGGDALLIRQGEWHRLRTPAEMRKEWSDASKAWIEIARDTAPPFLVIRTLEGDMRASSGDWIIEGVKREHYPCRPDIFAATYEEV